MADNPLTRVAEATRGFIGSIRRAREMSRSIDADPEQLNPLHGQRTDVRPVTNGDVWGLGFGNSFTHKQMGRVEQLERRVLFNERQLPPGHKYVIEDGVPPPAGFGEGASTQLVGEGPFVDDNDRTSTRSVDRESFVDENNDESLHAKPIVARDFLSDEFRDKNDDVSTRSVDRESFVDENNDELLHAKPVVAEDFFSNEFHDNRTVARGVDPFADENEVPKDARRGLSAEQKERARLLVPELAEVHQSAAYTRGNENDDLAH